MVRQLKCAVIFSVVQSLTVKGAKEITNFSVRKSYLRPAEKCFTQGIYVEEDKSVIETCGLFDESYIRRFTLNENEEEHPTISERQDSPGEIFLEGIARINDKIWTLTWQNNKILVHDSKSWGKSSAPIHEIPWNYGEGWGLTTDGCKFYANTGKDFILHLDQDGKELKRVHVKANGAPLNQMNDMVYVAPNKLWVNVWYSNLVFRINADTGKIEKWFDMSREIPYAKSWNVNEGATPNGLAYHYDADSATDKKSNFLVTGKLWPRIYNLKLTDADLCGPVVNSDSGTCASAPRSPCWSGAAAVGGSPKKGHKADQSGTSGEEFSVSVSWFFLLLSAALSLYTVTAFYKRREKKY